MIRKPQIHKRCWYKTLHHHFIMDLSSKQSAKVDFEVVHPLKKNTTCLFYNKALNVSSLDWSQG